MALTKSEKERIYKTRIKLMITSSMGLSNILLWSKAVICDCKHPENTPITSTHNKIFVYDSFFDLQTKVQMYYIAHQVLHIALRHHFRAARLYKQDKGNYNHNAAVAAQDLIVNWSLSEAKWLEIPRNALKFQDILSSKELNDKPPAKWKFEELYKHIIAKNDNIKVDNDIELPTDPEQSDVTSVQNDDLLWEKRIQRAMSLSGECNIVRKMLSDIPKSETPWNVLLKRYLNKYLSNKSYSSYARPHKRTSAGIVPIYLPSNMFNKTTKEVAFVIDTSGSVSNDELTSCLSEVLSAQKATGSAIRLIMADAAVMSDTVIPQFKANKANIIKTFKDTLRGGGGTSFIPAIELLEKNPPDICIYLTDTYGAFPISPPKDFDVIWVSSTEQKAPWGKTIHMKT